MRLIDLDKVEIHKQLEPNENGICEIIEVVYKDDLENLEIWTPEEVTLWCLTQNNITKIEDNRKGYEKTYKLAQYGKWKETDSEEPCFYYCSNCGCAWDDETDYCPSCGAQMEGKA